MGCLPVRNLLKSPGFIEPKKIETLKKSYTASRVLDINNMEITNQPQPKNNYAGAVQAFTQDLMDIIEKGNSIDLLNNDSKKELMKKARAMRVIFRTIQETQDRLIDFMNEYFKSIQETGNELDYKKYTNIASRELLNHIMEITNE